jgi:hypothetical protein
MESLPLFYISSCLRKARRKWVFFCRLQITLHIASDLRSEEPFDLSLFRRNRQS